ncbi:4640_t:CDS:2 [Funneliformis caledonium]|uniref:4640_t:CDS:1 n=1 Tax=Funneliformis caledonium TaxID=1117310 RepID=A0A9N9A443_9GLOM|nr:4640_t:CDS:2 [Funneliformis caledonium]
MVKRRPSKRIIKEHSEENEEKEQSRFDLAYSFLAKLILANGKSRNPIFRRIFLPSNYNLAESTLQLTNDLSDFKERKKRLEGSAASLEEMEYQLEQKYLEDLEKNPR